MAWDDRLIEAAYTAPNGTRTTFTYEDTEHSYTRRGSEYNFAGYNGSLVVTTGSSSRVFPMDCIFHGDNCDLESAAFAELLAIEGVGLLEHPTRGRVNVVAMGEIATSEALKSAGNEARVKVVFYETILDVYPTAQTDLSYSALLALEEANAATAQTFADSAGTNFRATLRSQIKVMGAASREAAQGVASVEREIDAIQRDLDLVLAATVEDPINVGFQVIRLIQAPGVIVDRVTDRLQAAVNLIEDAIGRTFSASNDLQALGSVGLLASTAVNSDLLTRGDALNLADILLTQFSAVVDWRETALEFDTSGAYEAMQKTVATTAGYLVQISFTLKQEKQITLDRPRGLVELHAELYPDGSSDIDFFINSNSLSGSEILELPKGREIVYYV